MFKLFVSIAALIWVALASPLKDSCTVTSYDAVSTAVSSCTNIVIKGITVPAGKTLTLDLKTGTTLTFDGTITFAHSNWAGPLVQVKGSKVTVKGTSNSKLDGLGAKYWDGKGDSGVTKPKFFRIKTTGNSLFQNINLVNCPRQCVSINSASNTVLSNWVIDVSAGDSAGGKNTDGFDVSSSTGITVQNSEVKNQDDCVAVNQGSNMIFKNLTCSGGHGLSLSVGQSSSSGSANTVKNVTFTDCSVVNSRNGIHVKTHTDAGTGSINLVTYKNIKFSGITNYAINIQQDYKNGKSTGTPTNNIPITNLNLQNVAGSMSGSSKSMPVYILCGSNGCSSWTWSKVSITNGKKSNSCNFSPSGFSC
ncbi:polygalacturonase-like isoform X2 [Anthonomus grandis grandis]|uniref:polygalacturonase-like isoform X2 n=1 Tax=Anthonomus grandis grandis TaxID=2921223 RepID=UPI00216528A1|nr:polygalacturonase-like isoform X2 [Anthonomus grandis grandis]XP_050299867.1 polygalacturonase-like isoform X2 [Anthonomus grandis grandis]